MLSMGISWVRIIVRSGLKSNFNGLNSWKRKLPLCKNDNLFFYPHLLKDDNEEQLLVAFENGMQHYLMSIPYEELIGGDTP